MTTLIVSTDTDYTIAPFSGEVIGQSIDAITFTTTGYAFATFETSQFGGFNISDSVLFTGNAQQNNVFVIGTAGMTSFSAVGWTFSNWNSGDQIYYEDVAGDQLWIGSSERDYFYDRLGNDTYLGGESFDTFFFNPYGIGSGGNDSVNGGNGIDSVFYDGQTQGVVVNLALGTATGADIGSDILVSIEQAFGGNGNDSLVGDAGVNFLVGNKGNDTLDGGAGDDDLAGGDGDDTYYTDITGEAMNEYNANVLVGGYDTVISSVSKSLPVNFEKLVLTGSAIGGSGNAGDNVIDARATTGPANLGGFGGNDLIYGSAFGDTMYGAAGSDTLIGGAGADSIWGDDTGDVPSTDFVSFETAQSAVAADLKPPTGGSAGTGTVGDAAGDIYRSIEGFIGSSFNDTLKGADVADTIHGGDGADSIEGRAGADLLNGGAQDDLLFGDAGNDFLIGGAGNDNLNGGADFDYASYLNASTTGGITISLALATAQNTGGAGIDTLTGIEGLYGSNFGDTLSGDNGAVNALYGLGGSDVLTGNGGFDYIEAGEGDDTLNGGAGDDYLLGGNGTDWVTYYGSSAAVYVDMSGASAFASGTAIGFDVLSGIERVYGSIYGDFLFGSAGADTLAGDMGIDILYGFGLGDSLDGGGDTDYIVGGAGADTITTGLGQDYVYFQSQNDGKDTVTDWRANGFDLLVIDEPSFGAGLAVNQYLSGAGNANRFVVGTAATAATGQFLWNSATSTLSWDADGTGAGAAVELVTLTGITTLTAGDILVL